MELPVRHVVDTTPRKSFAQILAVHRLQQEQQQEQSGVDENHGPLQPGRRLLMTNRARFLDHVAQATHELEQGWVSLDELEQSVQVLRLVPTRIELLANGPEIWERFEWTRNTSDDDISGRTENEVVPVPSWVPTKHQLLPY